MGLDPSRIRLRLTINSISQEVFKIIPCWNRMALFENKGQPIKIDIRITGEFPQFPQ